MAEALSPEEKRKKIKEEKKELAAWYESQRLYLRSIKLYKEAEETDEAERVRNKMIKEYREKAREYEKSNQLAQAANLYYIIGDNVKVRELKEKDPSIVIYYEYLSGERRISDVLGELPGDSAEEIESHFFQPNRPRVEEVQEREEESPAGDDINFCPYCGKDLRRFSGVRFCPYCGGKLS